MPKKDPIEKLVSNDLKVIKTVIQGCKNDAVSNL